MLNFFACILGAGIEPLSLIAGLGIGYLFYKDWKQLAWPLLLFVVPGIGSLDATVPAHGAFYLGTANFIAICLLATGSFRVFDYFSTRRA